MAQFPPASVAELTQQLRDVGYLADRGLATAAFLATTLGRPLLLEGEAGVGKTELAKVTADALGARLIRLQCYEGIDAGQALYEWDYARQMLKVRALDESRVAGDGSIDFLYSDEFLVERPLLQAIRSGAGCVLLIDEVDRADDEFEAFLLEVLSDVGHPVRFEPSRTPAAPMTGATTPRSSAPRPSPAWAWAITFLPSRFASLTAAESSSIVICGAPTASPTDNIPPVATIFI